MPLWGARWAHTSRSSGPSSRAGSSEAQEVCLLSEEARPAQGNVLYPPSFVHTKVPGMTPRLHFRCATLPWMYLTSRAFSSSDVAFISYVSLNFIFGLCTMLMTTMPRLLAILSKAQVSGPACLSRPLVEDKVDPCPSGCVSSRNGMGVCWCPLSVASGKRN